MKLKCWVNKNLLVIAVVILFLIFSGAYAYLIKAGTDWDIKIKTLYGNQDVLKNISISGAVLDYSSILQFNVQKGAVSQNLIRGTKSIRALNNANMEDTWDRITTDTAQYELNFMDNSGANLNITRRLLDKNNYLIGYDCINVKTGFRSNNNNDFDTPAANHGSWSNGAANSAEGTAKQGISINVNAYTPIMQFLDGKLYFIIPKLKDFSGNSGLYVVDKFVRNNRDAGVRKLADIPLTGGEDEMIALGKVENRLCLVRKNSSKLSIQMFDMEKGAFEAEYMDNIATGYNEHMYAIYPGPGHISIALRGDNGQYIYTYAVQGNIRRVSVVENYEEKGARGQLNMLYANNHLYVVQEVVSWPEANNENREFLRNPDEVIYISAYDDVGSMVFKGELDAGQNDDNIRQTIFNEKLAKDNRSGFIQYRRISKIKLDLAGDL